MATFEASIYNGRGVRTHPDCDSFFLGPPPQMPSPNVVTMRLQRTHHQHWSKIIAETKDLMKCRRQNDACHKWLVENVGMRLEDNEVLTIPSTVPHYSQQPRLTAESSDLIMPRLKRATHRLFNLGEYNRPTFHRFHRLPIELRAMVFLASIDPIILSGSKLSHARTTPSWKPEFPNTISLHVVKPSPPTHNKTYNHNAHHYGPHPTLHFAHIPLYHVNRESRHLAHVYYGTPLSNSIPFNPLQDTIYLAIDRLEDSFKKIWAQNPGTTWSEKTDKTLPEFRYLRQTTHREVTHLPGATDGPVRRIRFCTTVGPLDVSFWDRVHHVHLTWLKLIGEGSWRLLEKSTPKPFPVVKMLAARFPELRHITLDHTPLDDCAYNREGELRGGMTFDAEEEELCEISRLRVLDGLADADEKMRHLTTLSVVNHGVECSHLRARRNSPGDEWMAEGLYLSEFLKFGRGEVASSVGRLPFYADEVEEEEEEEDSDGGDDDEEDSDDDEEEEEDYEDDGEDIVANGIIEALMDLDDEG